MFSYDKFRTLGQRAYQPVETQRTYERLLARLRERKYFSIAVIALHLISGIGVLWYYRFQGPDALRFAFDYNNFLYFLVLHVTFSFTPTFWSSAVDKIGKIFEPRTATKLGHPSRLPVNEGRHELLPIKPTCRAK